MDYKKALTDKVILITGAGRSGTTILGKIIGSMEPAYYLFEPSIFKFIMRDAEWLRAIVFEDYWLLQVQGRNLNINEKDDSYFGNYRTDWVHPLGRNDDIRECLQSKLVIKLTEFQNRIAWAGHLFPGVKVIHIYRNGNDVVDSMLKRGWYTDEYMETGCLDHCYEGVPYFVYGQAAREFQGYNQITRCACVWRCSTEAGLKENDVVDIRYEDLAHTDFNILAGRLGLGITDLTVKHIRSIKEPRKHKPIIDQIQEPEKGRFMALMGRLEYV